MPVQDTSVLAYTSIIESGSKAEREAAVLDVVVRFPRSTAGEIGHTMTGEDTIDDNPVQHNIHSALHHLRAKGLVRRFPKRPCTRTKNLQYEYESGEDPARSSIVNRPKQPNLKSAIKELRRVYSRAVMYPGPDAELLLKWLDYITRPEKDVVSMEILP